ncbi:hypothetical protein J6590_066504 [Homalodisca vitripennis]|nr:hypothetical protein J6590_066504 [Homalodisca vitripennis]
MLENSLSPDLQPVASTLVSKPSGLDLEQRVTPSNNPYEINDDAYREMLTRHRKRRLCREEHPDLQTKGVNLNDLLFRCQFKKSTNREMKPSAKKQKLKSTILMDSLQVRSKRTMVRQELEEEAHLTILSLHPLCDVGDQYFHPTSAGFSILVNLPSLHAHNFCN